MTRARRFTLGAQAAQIIASATLILVATLGTGCDAADEPPPDEVATAASALAQPLDPCASVRCRAGTHCEAHGRFATCVPDPPICVCPLIYLPVCGADGHTYGNPCEARCAGTTVVHKGACLSPPPCDVPVEPAALSVARPPTCDPCVRVVDGQLTPVCEPHQRCIAEPVVCVRAPCPPVARCEDLPPTPAPAR